MCIRINHCSYLTGSWTSLTLACVVILETMSRFTFNFLSHALLYIFCPPPLCSQQANTKPSTET